MPRLISIPNVAHQSNPANSSNTLDVIFNASQEETFVNLRNKAHFNGKPVIGIFTTIQSTLMYMKYI